MTMGERIKELRKKNSLTQTQLANELNITKGTVSTWETNSRKPNFEVLVQMCEMFNASMDYITGHTDINNYHAITDDDMEQMGKWCVEDDLTDYALKYARLDEYGKQAVESVIIAEFNRCRAQECLADAEIYSGNINIHAK